MPFTVYGYRRIISAFSLIPGDQIAVRADHPDEAAVNLDYFDQNPTEFTWATIIKVEPSTNVSSPVFLHTEAARLGFAVFDPMIMRIGIEVDAWADAWESVENDPIPLDLSYPFYCIGCGAEGATRNLTHERGCPQPTVRAVADSAP